MSRLSKLAIVALTAGVGALASAANASNIMKLEVTGDLFSPHDTGYFDFAGTSAIGYDLVAYYDSDAGASDQYSFSGRLAAPAAFKLQFSGYRPKTEAVTFDAIDDAYVHLGSGRLDFVIERNTNGLHDNSNPYFQFIDLELSNSNIQGGITKAQNETFPYTSDYSLTNSAIDVSRPTSNGYVEFYDARMSIRSIEVSSAAGSVPEPASWALLIGGFGLSGAALRRRRAAVAA